MTAKMKIETISLLLVPMPPMDCDERMRTSDGL